MVKIRDGFGEVGVDGVWLLAPDGRSVGSDILMPELESNGLA